MQHLHAKRTLLSLAVAAAVSVAATAQASQADAPPAAAPPAPDEAETVRVIVTAQKKEQASVDVPASVTTVSAERLVRRGASRIEDYAADVPGLSFSSQRQGVTQVTLRGITTGQAQSASTTSFYIDEAPVGSMNAYAAGSTITPDLDPADLRQVEVLKGPQGTLYGAGALGGIVRYVTTPFDYQNFGGSVIAGASMVAHGGDGSLGRFALNIPLDGASMALRVSAFRRNDPGFIDNPVNGGEDVNHGRSEGGRIAFGWKLNYDWSLQVSALKQTVKSDGASVVDVDHDTLRPIAGDLQHASYVAEPAQVALTVYNATLRGAIGAVDLVSSTTYETIRSSSAQDGTPLYGALLGPVLQIPRLGVASATFIDTNRWTQELSLHASAFGDRLGYEGGIYLTDEDSGFRIPGFTSFDTGTGAPLALPPVIQAAIVSRYREASVFANASYALTPAIDLQAGVRYGEDRQKYGQVYAGLLIGPVPVVLDKAAEDRKATWMASARWKPSNDESLYVRAASGYRPGGPNAVPPAGVTGAQQAFAPDSLVSYEAGYKAVFAGGRASFEGAVFNTIWKDIQISTSAQGYNFFVNGGAARSRGAEAALYWAPLGGWSVRGSAGYTDAVLTSAAPAAGGLDGDRLPFVPKITSSLSVEYRRDLDGGWKANAGGSANYTGSRVSNFSQLVPIEAPSYTTLNVNAGLERGHWRYALYVKNAADRRGVTSVTAIGPSPAVNPYTMGVIVPRTIGLEAGYKF